MIRLDGEMLGVLLFVIVLIIISLIAWLNNAIEKYIDNSNTVCQMKLDNKALQAKLDAAEMQINHQKGIINALKYTSKYPLFMSNVSVRDRKAGR